MRQAGALLLVLLLTGCAPVVKGDGAATADAWSSAGSIAGLEFAQTPILLPTGKVLVLGGGPADQPTSAELYDPSSRSWAARTGIQTKRWAYPVVLLRNGKVLVTGGETDRVPGPRSYYPREVIAGAELYDPQTDRWTPAASMRTPRRMHTATLLRDGRVLVVGHAAATPVGDGSAELYDPETDRWSPAGTVQAPRSGHTASLLPSGKVLITGGETLYGPLATVELYDPATNSWSMGGRMTEGHSAHRATVLKDGRVLVTGGNGPSGGSTSAEIYDPSRDRWTSTASMLTARRHHSSVLLRDGRVLVAGGYEMADSVRGQVAGPEVYDPRTGNWALAGRIPSGRSDFSAILLPNGTVLVIGGSIDPGVKGGAPPHTVDAGGWVLDRAAMKPPPQPSPQGGGRFNEPSPQGGREEWSAFADVAFSDPQHGWLAAVSCGSDKSCRLLLYHTTDGSRWIRLDAARSGSLSWVEPRIKLVSGYDAYVAAGRFVLSTHDEGAHWFTADLSGEIIDVVVGARLEAWALVKQPERCCTPSLLLTRDGGKTWEAATLPPPLGEEVRLLWAAPAIWIYSTSLETGRNDFLISREAGGWFRRSAPCLVPARGLATAVADQAHRWLLCGNWPVNSRWQDKRLFASSDGGLTWSELPAPSSSGNVRGLVAVGNQTLLMTVVCGGTSRSTDGGRSWTAVAGLSGGPDGCGGPTHLMFSDSLHGWTVTSDQAFRTIDSGAHWEVAPAPSLP